MFKKWFGGSNKNTSPKGSSTTKAVSISFNDDRRQPRIAQINLDQDSMVSGTRLVKQID